MGKRLVRDRALDNWVVPGAEGQVRPVVSPGEHLTLLCAKLLEESGEVILAGNREELVKEVGDVLSVLEAFADWHSVSWEDVVRSKAKREDASGGFKSGMVWETPR